MSVVSKDLDLVETFRRCLGLSVAISGCRSRTGRIAWRVQWSGRVLYDALLRIGLTPAKSLTLRALTIPDEYFSDFFRGCIDGDGSVLVYTDRYHARKDERDVSRRRYVSLASASWPFVEWIRESVLRLTGLRGVIHARKEKGRNAIWLLRHAKQESLSILSWMYHSPIVPCLRRKRLKAEPFMNGMR